jgi:hypothetical protein
VPPPVKKPDDLAEVEAALSVLGGRHPDHVRRERETNEAIAAKQRALDAESRRERNRKLKLGLVVVMAIGAIGYGIVRAREREHVQEVALELVVAPAMPFVALGFAPIDGPGGARFGTRHADRAEADVEPGTCVVVVAASTEGPADFLVERDGDKIDAKGSLGFCTCAHETVTATVTSTAGSARSVRLLRKDARSFGGTFGFARTGVQPARVLESPCAEEHLDGWLVDPTRGRPAGTSAKPPDADSPLTRQGFSRLATGVASGPFVVVEPPFSSCTYVSSNQPDDRLSLRVAGGARVLSDVAGPIAFCDSHANTYVVFHSGRGELTAVGASSRLIGGLIGVREASLQAGLPAPATWIRAEDLAWDARETARASGIPEAATIDYSAAVPAKSPVHDARIVALSTIDGATVLPDTGPDLVFSTCLLELGKAPQNFCVQASPQRWRDTSTRGRAAGAEANLPYWLAVFAPLHDPELVRVEAQLLALARRLTRAGFDPTVLEAVTELPTGVDVAGRAGEDAIVAIALEPQAPWAIPCTNGPAWRLDGDPLVIDLPAGKHAALTHMKPVASSKEARRTVVFRRTIKK